MKRYFAVLAALFILFLSCDAFAEICDLEGLTFEVPSQFSLEKEEGGMKTYYDQRSQAVIMCTSIERLGANSESLLEETMESWNAPLYRYEMNCSDDGIPHLSVNSIYNSLYDALNIMVNYYFDEERVYMLVFAKNREMTDDDVSANRDVLRSVKMDDPKAPLEFSDKAARLPATGYRLFELHVPELDGMEFILRPENTASAGTEDSAVALKVYDTENKTLEDAIGALTGDMNVSVTTYKKDCEIGGVPYVDFTFEGNEGQVIKAALFLNDENKRGYAILYGEQTGMSDEGYEKWDYLLSNTYISARKPQYDVLQRGDKGDSVKRLQEALIALGYLNDTADGNFGPRTERAIEEYQKANGLQVTKIADQITQEYIFADEAALN